MAILAITGRHVCDSTLCDRSDHMLSPMMQVRDEEMELWEPDGKLRLGKSGRSCFDPFPLNLVEMRGSHRCSSVCSSTSSWVDIRM